ncbi:MAG: hypothetical protein IJY08_01665 [Clostridia bacterium]|nr:hypothetical protein [Clostridia bacterium]
MNNRQFDLTQILASYFTETPDSCTPYGNGHINDTFLVTYGKKRYILQRMNSHVFPCPEKVMENIIGITEHIKARTQSKGEDASRATLTVLPTLDGDSFCKDSSGEPWRVFEFTEGTNLAGYGGMRTGFLQLRGSIR